MAGVYLAIGGDVSLTWDTNNKMDIIRDLEEQIEDKVLFTAPLKLYQNTGLRIKHQYGEPGQNKPYRLRVFFEIERFAVLSTDFLANIADKRLHSLLRRVVSMILYNPTFSPINLVDVGDRYLDYLEEIKDEVEDDVKERVSEEIAFFKKEFPYTKAGAKRIDRLKKIRQSIKKLTDEQNAWLNNVFQYLETVYSSITFEEFWNGDVKMADCYQNGDDEDEEEDCSDMFNPEYMFFITTSFGTVYNIHCESVDDDMNSGISCPNFRININNEKDINKLRLHMRVYGLLGDILDRGGEVWSTTSAK